MLLNALAGAALLLGANTEAGQENGCRAMLNGAPENVLQLEAVRSCRGESAACGYLNGVITLICPASGVRQVLGAERLRSLRFRNGTLAGECSSGAWRRDAGLPGCYP
jgi:hypothetical protein